MTKIETRVPSLAWLAILICSCSTSPILSSSTDPVLSLSLSSPEIVTRGIDAARVLSSGGLSSPSCSPGSRRIASPSAAEMARTPDGAEYLSLLVACALPADASLVVGDLEFFGELGLAPEWTRGRLGASGRGWVSACVLARLNGESVAVPVSLRGSRGQLSAASDERSEFSVEAGAFYGNVFVDGPSPEWFACGGLGQAADPRSSGLVGTCAREDSLRPGLSPCGMTFVGSCQDACERSRRGSAGGSYRRCGSNREVITQFVLP